MLEECVKIVTKWTEICENITEEKKSELVGKVIEIAIREIMENHMYTFDGQVYQGYCRGLDHAEAHRRQDPKNAMGKHTWGHHLGVIPRYEMVVVKKHRSPIGRQIGEAVMIEMSKAEGIMNSKGEWNGSKIPRKVV